MALRKRRVRHRVLRARAGLDPLEHSEAVDLMKVVRLHENRYPELAMLAHVANEGTGSKARGARLKAEGVKPGYPDYLLDVGRQGFHGLRIELKPRTGGTVSAEQKGWHLALREEGFRVEVCRGWEAAWAVLRDYLGIR